MFGVTRRRVEKLQYMHRNPVKRELVEKPEDWEWSSFRHYVSGVDGIVEMRIQQWTARKREQLVHVNAPSSSLRLLERQGGILISRSELYAREMSKGGDTFG